MAGLLTSAIPAVVGFGIEAIRRAQMEPKLDPYLQDINAIGQNREMPTGFRATANSLGPDVSRAFDRYGATRYTNNLGEDSYLLQGPAGSGPYFNTRLQSEIDRYAQEKKAEAEATAVRDQWAGEVDKLGKTEDQGIKDFNTQTEQGLSDLKLGLGESLAAHKSAWEDANQNLQASMREIDAQVQDFKQQAAFSVQALRDLKGEALAHASDQTAKSLEGLTSGIHARLQAQEAEIDSDPTLTAGQKAALKSQTRFTNGMELRQTAAQVSAEESKRLSAIETEHNAMIAQGVSSMSTSLATLQGSALTAKQAALAQNTVAKVELSKAIQDTYTAYANQSTAYRVTQTANKAAFITNMESLKLQGHQTLYDMTTNIPRAFFDMSSVLVDSWSFMMSQETHEMNLAMQRLNSKLSAEGMTINYSMPFATAGNEAGLSNYLAQNAPQPEQPSVLGQIGGSVASAGLGALTGGIGSTVGKSAGGMFTDYLGMPSPGA